MNHLEMNKLGLLSPEGDTGASGSVASDAQAIFAPAETNGADSGESGGGEQQTTQGEQGQESASTVGTDKTVAQPGNVTMTNEQLTQLAAQMVKGMPQMQAPTAVQQQPQQITPEQQAEFDRQFNVVRVTPERFQAIMGFAPASPEQMKALETILHDVARMSNAMTNYQVQQTIQQREQAAMGRIAPIETYFRQQQAAAIESEFYKGNPDLKDFGDLCGEVAASMNARGERFPDQATAIKTLATRVRDLLTKARGGTPPPKGQGAVARKAMPTTSMGGRTGTGGSQTPVSGPQAVFGDMDS